MATLGTYFYDGSSFQFATVLCTNASLTTPAPNGWYSQGGIYREMAGGILGAPQPCVSCIYACNDPAIAPAGGLLGKFIVTVDVGIGVGAVIAEFNLTSQNTIARATWTYNGVTASEYSSANYGYVQGVLGNEYLGIQYNCISNALGSNGNTFSGTEYSNTGSTFVPTGITPTWGPYLNQASGGCDLVNVGTGNPNYGINTMVIPKPNTTPSTIQFVIDGPLCAGQSFSLEVKCPAPLSSMQMAYGPGTDCPTAANTPLTVTYYYHNTNGNAYPQVHDWVFTDINGVTPLADAFYFVYDPNYPSSGNIACIEVVNGVIKTKV